MPLDGHNLIIEPTYPRAAELMAVGRKDDACSGEDADLNRAVIRNTFWSWMRRCNITIWEVDGKLEWGPTSQVNKAGLELATLGAAAAWGIEQEGNAVHTLGELLKHHSFKQYLMTGMFLERSKRSGVSYLFRKLRPTVALRDNRVLCTLCLHPIGYYEGSWAGAMTPTDDVIAHLMLMRGDEHMFWRRANQHPPWRNESGL